MERRNQKSSIIKLEIRHTLTQRKVKPEREGLNCAEMRTLSAVDPRGGVYGVRYLTLKTDEKGGLKCRKSIS